MNDCHIFATFVLGKYAAKKSEDNEALNDQVNNEAQEKGDITFVYEENGTPVEDRGNIMDNNLKSKVFNWIRHMTDHHPGVTHIIKADMDTYPFPGRAAQWFVDNTPENGQLLGWQGQFYGFSAGSIRCMFQQMRKDPKILQNGKLPSPGSGRLPCEDKFGEDHFIASLTHEYLTQHCEKPAIHMDVDSLKVHENLYR
eukprot:gb/GFBE01017287.1/.p1 GENE.gb/GFBE01017287.1/~~gb/GFBE01017287.1/.p1  ORF type:complete len:198 (+),score=47.52 gb/GFBE01017287.1/:1-594(+)